MINPHLFSNPNNCSILLLYCFILTRIIYNILFISNNFYFDRLQSRWILAKRCVCLALKETPKDIQVEHKVQQLIKCLKKKRTHIQLNNETNNEFSINPESFKYYVILVYDVKDIKNVDLKERYEY